MSKRTDAGADGQGREDPEPTIWKMPDEVWEIAEEILAREYPKRAKGHRRVDLRPKVAGILYRLRLGFQRLPAPLTRNIPHARAQCDRRWF